jgi:glc operon protein GlcG
MAFAKGAPVPFSLRSKQTLTFDLARALADVAAQEIARHQFAMFVAIVDDAATPLFVGRFNDAQAASFEVALRKAEVAVRFRRPTKGFEDRVIKDGRVNLLSLPGICAVEGGVPLAVDGAVVGAIGVSGGTGVEDGQVAAAVAAALPSLLS